MFGKTNYITYIQENKLTGTSVYRINASDLDDKENAKVTYFLITNSTEESPVSTYISINSMTGILYAKIIRL